MNDVGDVLKSITCGECVRERGRSKRHVNFPGRGVGNGTPALNYCLQDSLWHVIQGIVIIRVGLMIFPKQSEKNDPLKHELKLKICLISLTKKNTAEHTVLNMK